MNPAELTAPLGSVAEPVRVIVAPEGLNAGRPVKLAVGATLETETVPVAGVLVRLVEVSFAVSETV